MIWWGIRIVIGSARVLECSSSSSSTRHGTASTSDPGAPREGYRGPLTDDEVGIVANKLQASGSPSEPGSRTVAFCRDRRVKRNVVPFAREDVGGSSWMGVHVTLARKSIPVSAASDHAYLSPSCGASPVAYSPRLQLTPTTATQPSGGQDRPIPDDVQDPDSNRSIGQWRRTLSSQAYLQPQGATEYQRKRPNASPTGGVVADATPCEAPAMQMPR